MENFVHLNLSIENLKVPKETNYMLSIEKMKKVKKIYNI